MFLKPVSAIFPLLVLSGCLTLDMPEVQVKRAPAEQVLTWKELVRETLDKNPDLQSARYAVTASERSRDIAFGDYFPSVDGVLQRSVSSNASSGLGSSGNNSSGNTSGGGGGGTRNRFSLDVVANQSLFDGFKTTGNWIKARKNLSAIRYAYLGVSADVRNKLRLAYINLMRLQRLYDVNRRISERRKQNAELVKLRYEAGRENLGSSMRAEAIMEQAFFDVRLTARHRESETIRLARETGGDFVLPVYIDDDIEKLLPALPTSTPDYAALAEETPNVLQQIKLAEALKAEVVAAQSEIWPHLDGNADYGNSGTRPGNMGNERSIGLVATLPFFNGGKNIEGIAKAKADYDSARETAIAARNETLANLADAWAKYVDAIEFVAVRWKFLEASRKRAEIIRVQYATGLSGFQDFDIAEQENADAEKSYVESLAAVLTAQANWELIKGETLEEVLNEH